MSEQVRRRLEKIVKDEADIPNWAELCDVVESYRESIKVIKEILLDEKK